MRKAERNPVGIFAEGTEAPNSPLLEQALEKDPGALHSFGPEALLAFAETSPKAHLILPHLDKLGEGLRERVLLALVANRRVYREDPSRYEEMVKAIARRPDLTEEVMVLIARREMGGLVPVAELWKNPRLRDYPRLRRRVAETLAATTPSRVPGIEDVILSILEEYPDLVRLALGSASFHLLAHLIANPQFLGKFWREVVDLLPERGNLKLLARLASELSDPRWGEELLERVAEGEAREAVRCNLLVNPRLPMEWRRKLLGERPSLKEAFLFLSEDPETSVKALENHLEGLPDGDSALRDFLENLHAFPSEMRERVIAKASKQLSHLREWGFDLPSLLETLKAVLRHHPNEEGVAAGKRLLLHALSIEGLAKGLTPEVLRQVLQDLAAIAGKVPQGLLLGIAREGRLSPEHFQVLMDTCPEEEKEAFLNALANNPKLPKEAIEFLSSLDSPPEAVYFNPEIPLSPGAIEKALEKGEIRLLVERYDLPPKAVERILETALEGAYPEMSSAIESLLNSGVPLSPRSLRLLLESGYRKAVLAALRTAIYVPEVPLGSLLKALSFLSERGMRVDHYLDLLKARLESVGIAEEALGL